MLPEAKGPALVRIASAWAKARAPATEELVEDTREAVGALRPQDLAGAEELVRSLLSRLEPAEERRFPRGGPFALPDGGRRRPFPSALRPGPGVPAGDREGRVV